jgi:hypothetical protein
MFTRVPELAPEQRAQNQLTYLMSQYSPYGDPREQERLEQNSLIWFDLVEQQKELDEQYPGEGRKAASDELWLYAWREKEEFYRLKNIPRESHTSPDPLLISKSASLAPSSAERRQAEITKSTIDNTTSNVGSGLDALTRESYKETKRLVKHSDMLQESLLQPLPPADALVGEEEGTIVSNLQSWQPAVANAVKPVSDALGSHSDTNSSINTSQMGSEQFMPTAVVSSLDNISSQFANEADVAFKSIQFDSMQHMPNKMCGSLNHLAQSSSNDCYIPFEIASDVYGGLLKMMDQIANFGDLIMNGMTLFSLTPLGGLKDGLFPIGKLSFLLKPIMMFAGPLGGLSQLLAGFSALKSLTGTISKIGSGLSSLISDPAKLAAMLVAGANVAAIVGGLAGKKVKCVNAQLGLNELLSSNSNLNLTLNITTRLPGVVGGLPRVKKGLGNLGFVLGGGTNVDMGRLTVNIRNPRQILAGIMPPEITKALRKLNRLSNLGLVGNLGFSIGASLDSLSDSSFSKCMSKYATHSSIVGPLFNKQTSRIGSYSQESSLDFYENFKFAKGGQGNKGVVMMGPGSTSSQKVFGEYSGASSLTNASVNPDLQQASSEQFQQAAAMDNKANDASLSASERAKWATLASRSRALGKEISSL